MAKAKQEMLDVESRELVLAERGDLVPSAQENPAWDILRAMNEKGLTAESAAAFDKMCDTALKMDAVQAKKAYTAARAALQADLPHVIATKMIPGNDGTTRSVYAPFEDVMRTIKPHLVKHGFSVSFNGRVEPDGKRLTAICTVAHVGGHSESNEFSVRVSAPPKCSDAQADGSTMSYAQRYVLLAALAIAVDKDTDARLDGAAITPAQAIELELYVKNIGANPEKVLAAVGVTSFAEIPAGEVPRLKDSLTKWVLAKEKKDGKAKPVAGSSEPLPIDPMFPPEESGA
ncbi:MAG TPA: ERF family protein [Phycisphaerae bacterium]|nr:ERF family protein [Phycisphaerae bacterium]HUW99427.1 ERF family protein [Phycisphaerae bacterium]